MSVVTVATAEGADIDLSGKTVDELIEIQKAVNEAIYAQGGKVVLPQGELLVGVDIAPGSYTLEAHNVGDDSRSSSYAVVIWKSREAMEQFDVVYEAYLAAREKAQNDKKAGKEYEYPAGIVQSEYQVFGGEFDSTQPTKITLEEGNILRCTIRSGAQMDLTIEKTVGLFMD